MSISFNETERFLVENSAEIIELAAAHEKVAEKVDDLVQEVGARLRAWAKPKGWQVDPGEEDASFYCYRPAWVDRKIKDAMVYFCLSGFAPKGLLRTEDDYPFVWILTDNLKRAGLGRPQRREFEEALREALGEDISEWEGQELGAIAGRFFKEIDAKGRAELSTRRRQALRLRDGALGRALQVRRRD